MSYEPGLVAYGRARGPDYAMRDALIQAVRAGGPSPISLREWVRMTLPGVDAAEAARQGGELTRIVYPWSVGE